MSDDAPKPEDAGEDTQPSDQEAASQSTEQPETEPAAATPSSGPEIAAVDFGEITDDEKMMAMLAHLSGIVSHFVGPLIFWLIKKDESKFVDDQGKEALNFQITTLIGYAVAILLGCVTFCIGGFGVLIAIPIWIVSAIFSVLAGLEAKEGKAYRYPFALRLVK